MIKKYSKLQIKNAIREKCKDCMGHEDYMNRIHECDSSDTCALWPHRPYINYKNRSKK